MLVGSMMNLFLSIERHLYPTRVLGAAILDSQSFDQQPMIRKAPAESCDCQPCKIIKKKSEGAAGNGIAQKILRCSHINANECFFSLPRERSSSVLLRGCSLPWDSIRTE
jgi:hypothetical protein